MIASEPFLKFAATPFLPKYHRRNPNTIPERFERHGRRLFLTINIAFLNRLD